jgi:hypothetical protein
VTGPPSATNPPDVQVPTVAVTREIVVHVVWFSRRYLAARPAELNTSEPRPPPVVLDVSSTLIGTDRDVLPAVSLRNMDYSANPPVNPRRPMRPPPNAPPVYSWAETVLVVTAMLAASVWTSW